MAPAEKAISCKKVIKIAKWLGAAAPDPRLKYDKVQQFAQHAT